MEKHLGVDIKDKTSDGGASLTKLREIEKNFFTGRHWVRPRQPKKGILYRLGFKKSTPMPSEWNDIIGTYTFTKNNHGILPLFIRAMQNNYSGGIESFKFYKEGERLFFISTEGSLQYKIEVGFYDFKTTVLDFGGEKYIVRAMGEATEDEDRNLIYKLELLLPEMPNSRRIKFTLAPSGKLIVKMSEIPNHKLAEPLIDAIYTTNPKFAFAVGILERRLGDKFLVRKLESLFEPTLVGADIHSINYRSILADEKAKEEESTSSTSRG